MAKTFAPGEGPRVVNGSTWGMLAIALIFLGLRLYTRISRSKRLWWDDYILTASACLLVASTACLTKAMSMGYLDGDQNSVPIVLFWRISQTLQIVSLALGKTSFGFTLLRFSTKWQKYVIWFVIITNNILFTIHVFLLWMAICGIDQGYQLPGSCWSPVNSIIMNVTTSMYSGVTDFVLAILPWKVILSLNMKKSEKISVAMAMSVGVIAGIAGVMKAVQSIITVNYTSPSFVYNLTVFWIFVLAEPNATIIAASIPSLRGLVRDVRNNYAGGYHNSDSLNAAGYLRSTASKFHVHPATNRSHRADNEVADNAAGDADSDRSILGGHSKMHSGIEKTTEISVNYDSETREMGHESYEMQPRRGGR